MWLVFFCIDKASSDEQMTGQVWLCNDSFLFWVFGFGIGKYHVRGIKRNDSN